MSNSPESSFIFHRLLCFIFGLQSHSLLLYENLDRPRDERQEVCSLIAKGDTTFKYIMTQTIEIGCALLAFSPLAWLLLKISQRPQLVIVALGGAFAWLFCMLCIGVLWVSIVSWFGEARYPAILIVSSVLQNYFRGIYVGFYRRTERQLKGSSELCDQVMPLDDRTCGLAAGIGFGGMHALVVCGSVLASGSGSGSISGDYFSDACPLLPLSWTIALFCLAYFAIDMVLTPMAFLAERLQSTGLNVLIYSIHLTASLFNLANREYFGCKTSLTMTLLIALGSVILYIWMQPAIDRSLAINRSSKDRKSSGGISTNNRL